jgi:hypothetical protein
MTYKLDTSVIDCRCIGSNTEQFWHIYCGDSTPIGSVFQTQCTERYKYFQRPSTVVRITWAKDVGNGVLELFGPNKK